MKGRPLPKQPPRCPACGRRQAMDGVTCACQARLIPLAAGHLAPIAGAAFITVGPAQVLAWRDQHRAARAAAALAHARHRPAGMTAAEYVCLQPDLDGVA